MQQFCMSLEILDSRAVQECCVVLALVLVLEQFQCVPPQLKTLPWIAQLPVEGCFSV
jgi:hypothetical protein